MDGKERGTYACRNVDFAVQLADLLPDGVMGPVQDGATEDDGSVGLQVFSRDGGYFQVHLLAVANDERVEVVVVVHDVELGDTRDKLAV